MNTLSEIAQTERVGLERVGLKILRCGAKTPNVPLRGQKTYLRPLFFSRRRPRMGVHAPQRRTLVPRPLHPLTLSLTLLLSCPALAQTVVHAPPLPPVTPQVITHGSRLSKTVALTFDACQTRKMAGYDAKIIGILRATHTPATLVLGGRWMETHPAATRSLAADPLFELGNHSYLHPHMTTLNPARMRQELLETQDAMYRLTGKQGTVFRPPYGEYNALLVIQAAQLGLKTLTWEVVTGDPDPHIGAASIVHTVLTRAKPGSVVIMHMNGRGWHTAEALPAVIRGLRKRGYRFVTVSKLW